MKRLTLNFLFIGSVLFCLVMDNFAADDVYIPGGSPYPSESDTGSFSRINTLPEVLIDSNKYIDSSYAVQFTSAENDDTGDSIYLSNLSSPKKRNGIFQKFSASSSWIPTGGDGGLGLLQSDLSMVFAFPLPTVKSPFLITPSFRHSSFDRKNSSTLDFYSAGVDFRWLFPLVEKKFTLDISGAAIYNGNFHGETKDAMRYPAHIAAIWNFNPRMQLIFGAAFLDRVDEYNWLPIGGLIWTPNSDLNIELLFPRAKIARRLSCFDQSSSMFQEKFSGWVYAAFEFSGGEWMYAQGGTSRIVNYRDCRFILGYEHKNFKNMTLGLETGCVVGREFKAAGLPKDTPDTGFFVRLRIVL